MNDLWEYSGGQWTWVAGSNAGPQNGTYGTLSVAASANVPGSRYQAVGWTDASGNLWLFGGNGYDSAGNQGTLNDLWKFSGGEWTWMGGSNLADQPGAYGTLGVAASANIPSTRFGAISWTDSSGNFWLFGGFHRDSSNANGVLNDLWKYSNGEWTWESGSKLPNQNGVYGTQGMPAPGNVPSSRYWGVSWIDSAGNFWLFGGAEVGAPGQSEFLNDLWKYSDGEWTWVDGSTQINQPGVYGTKGSPGMSNDPGSRQQSLSWTDAAGNLWLFGGNAFDSVGSEGLLNDLWEYAGGEWTWISGSKVINQNGVYGGQGILAPGNIPGARLEQCGWADKNGNLWLFGGYGVPASGTEGNLNDLWMYMP
jgi:N-acetylneuraminic acid mutarotase